MAEVKDPSRESLPTSSSPVPVAGSEESKEIPICNATDEDEKKAAPATGPPSVEYPGAIMGSILTIALLLAMFLVALDMHHHQISTSDMLSAGSTDLAKIFPNPADLKIVVDAYMKGLKAAWIWSIALAGISFLVSLAAERKSVRLDRVKKRAENKTAAEAATP